MSGFQLRTIAASGDVPFRSEKSRMLLDHWQTLRNNGPVPRAEDIHPGSMKSLLPEIFIFELPDENTVRYRLAGTQVVARMGFEPKGMNLLDFTPPQARAEIGWAFSLVACHNVGGLAHFSAETDTDQHRELELTLLPIVAPQGQAPRILAIATLLAAAPRHMDGGKTRLYGEDVENAILFDIGFGFPPALTAHPLADTSLKNKDAN